MGHSQSAIQKGDLSEALVRAYYTMKGYTVLTAETHETHYDMVVCKDKEFKKVQVKTCVRCNDGISPTLIRIRNKRGQNGDYQLGDYDILVGVWREGGKMYFFDQPYLLNEGFGETITVAREDGEDVRYHRGKKPKPFEVFTFEFKQDTKED